MESVPINVSGLQPRGGALYFARELTGMVKVKIKPEQSVNFLMQVSNC